jgi:thymidylate kinase
MLIVEGTDLTGKTVLCEKLRERLAALDEPHEYAHLGLLPAEWDYVNDYVSRIRPSVVQDRFFLSEAAYGPVVRGGSRVSPIQLDALTTMLRAAGGFTVVLVAEEDGTLDMAYRNKREPELFELRDIVAVNRQFATLSERYADHEVQVGLDRDGAVRYATDDDIVRIVREYLIWRELMRALRS